MPIDEGGCLVFALDVVTGWSGWRWIIPIVLIVVGVMGPLLNVSEPAFRIAAVTVGTIWLIYNYVKLREDGHDI